jgi:hypothetical protein
MPARAQRPRGAEIVAENGGRATARPRPGAGSKGDRGVVTSRELTAEGRSRPSQFARS